MLFNLKDWMIQRTNQPFFDNFSYGDLLNDAAYFYSLLKNKSDFVGLKMSSPYLTFAAILGSIAAGKKAVIISHLENPESINNLKTQVSFTDLYTDEAFFNKFPCEFPSSFIDENDQSLILFTSGSSGVPKGVVITFGNLYYSALGFSEFFNLNDQYCTLMNLPHHHIGGLMSLWRAFFIGGRLTAHAELPFDIVSVVPLQLSRILQDQRLLEKYRLCKIILVGGSRLSSELRQSAQNAGLTLYETYGMSETTSLILINGEVLNYRQACLGKEGKILIKGKTLCAGLMMNDCFTPLKLNALGYFETNDIGIGQKDKILFSHRDDLIFISGGENINPLLIEDASRLHPQITDLYVLPVVDGKWGEMGVALYESTSELTSENIISFLKSKIHPYFIPKRFFSHTFKNAGGIKPKRNELKKIAEEYYLKDLFSYEFKEKLNSPVIVFFHGFTGSKEDFYFLEKSLPDHSLLFIDLPGHGKTEVDHFFSTHDLLVKLSRFIKLFTHSPLLYGYSMGGRVALQLALNYLDPTLLILESAGPGLITKDEQNKRLSEDIKLTETFKGTKDFLIHWYSQELFSGYKQSANFPSDLMNKEKGDLKLWQKSQILLSQGNFPLLKENLLKLNKTTYPIHYLYGSEDKKYKAYAQYFNSSYSIQGASHNPHKTHPVEISEIIKTILK